jgi:hypothetical protein
MNGQVKALCFSEFLNESESQIFNPGWLCKRHIDDLNDFSFEKDLPFKIDLLQKEWERLQRDYNWNRGGRGPTGEHLAINAKIYVSPDLAEINSELGLKLDENELMRHWWTFIEVSRDQFTEDLEETFGWIKGINWGGKSEGWLLIWPDRDSEDFIDNLDYGLSQYVNTKNNISEEEMQAMKGEDSNPAHQRLISLGLAEPSEELRDMKREIRLASEQIDKDLQLIRKMRAGLEEIAEIPKEFEKNAVENFKSWLENYLDY